MGRWSQASRTGGGPPTLNYIVAVTAVTDLLADIEYAANVDAASFLSFAFQSNPSGEQGASIAQQGPRTIRVTWGDSTVGDDEVAYNGTTPGILTPQTIQYS